MSNHFEYRNGQLFAEDISVAELAEQYGTPLYVYSRATLTRHYRVWTECLSERDMICYAIKANSNLGVLSILAKLGSGFDIVSGGELERVLAAGGDPARIVFSGLGKTAEDMRRALDVGVRCFNVESVTEMEQLNRVALDSNRIAPISIRVNPDVDAKTHPYISTGLKENKFGIDISEAAAIYQRASGLKGLRIVGVDCHIGSQLTELSPFLDALERVLDLIDSLAASGIEIEHLDLGGGLGVTYESETPPSPAELCAAIKERMGDRPQSLIFEPGRSIAGNAGILVTRVQILKPAEAKNFAIVDAAMNDMLRPALYSSYMRISEVDQNSDVSEATWDVVGSVCESADFLGKDRKLRISEGDLLAQHTAGAYGFVMSSNYNTRGRAAEVLVDGNSSHLVRERESIADMLRGEHVV
jgi:diaminopimelate decarboxylase